MHFLFLLVFLAGGIPAFAKDDGQTALDEVLARGPVEVGLYRDGGRVQPHEWRSARSFGAIFARHLGYSLFLMTGTESFGTPAFDGVVLDPEGRPVANFSLKTSNRFQDRYLNALVEDAFGKMTRYSHLEAWNKALRYVSVGRRQRERNQQMMLRWLSVLQPDSERPQWLLLHLTSSEVTENTIVSLKEKTKGSKQTLFVIDARTIYIFRDGEEVFGFEAFRDCERTLRGSPSTP